jgi:alpha-glucosidase
MVLSVRFSRTVACAALFAVAAAATYPAAAAPQTPTPQIVILGKATGFRSLRDGLQVQVGKAALRISALRDDILRVQISSDGKFSRDASWAVLPQAQHHVLSVRAFGDRGAIGFRTASLKVRVERSPLRLIVEDMEGHVISADAVGRPVEFHGAGFEVHKAMPDGMHYFGLGDKTGPLDRRGEAFTLWNTDAYGFQESTDPIYKSIPFFMGVMGDGRSYGLLLDDTWRSWFDFGKAARDSLAFGADGGALDYYLMVGATPKDVVRDYAYLTGPSPLPPLWSLGYQQSRYSYMSDAEVRSVADRLRADKIPADVIYLDIDYQDRDRPFTVNTKTFPDIAKLAADLRKEDIRLVTIIDLHIAYAPNQGYAPYDSGVAGDDFVKNPDGSTYVAPVWPGPSVFPDFTRAETRAWWGGLYKDFVADGISGFWNDMNEPAIFETPTKTMPLDVVHRIDEPGFSKRNASHAEIHNLYGMENTRATYEGLQQLAPDERPFVLTRASYAGGQRYAATWTGDNTASWNHLRLSVPMLLNLGLSGFAYSGADVGGFEGSPNADLLTRWLEVAAFTPFYRNHTNNGSLHREPWVDGPAQEAIRRHYIEERYRLLPYLYALADENARTGLPLMRPVFLEFPEVLNVKADFGSEFLLGDHLLITPPPYGESLVPFDVTLPKARWYDYWTGLEVTAAAPDGARGLGIVTIQEIPALDALPVFVRGGTILARQPLVQSTSQTPDGPLQLDIFPGKDCTATLYWDDGHSLGYKKGAFLRQTLHCDTLQDGLALTFDAREGSFAPWWKSIEVVLHGWDGVPARATLAGTVLTTRLDTKAHTLRVTVPDQAGRAELRIER